MKKIDLHIHTVPTFSDAQFVFSLDVFKRYVTDARLDAVAVTNHDIFDAKQFLTIRDSLPIPVFPGIEINIGKGHLLVFTTPDDVDDFQAKANIVSSKIQKVGDRLTFETLTEIYGNLSNYLLIPHYDKAPPIGGELLEKLRPYISAGEVDSAKKFVRIMKDNTGITPILFSDSRMREGLDRIPSRHTYINCGEISLAALKSCLLDKAKVALTEADGNRLWEVLENGQKISTGLNVLMGARSSGKTHTLNLIAEVVGNTKYIQQFSLVQHEDDDEHFRGAVERKRSVFADDYLSGLKRVLEDVMRIDLVANERTIDRYLETLLRSAEDADRQDAFSKVALFDEVEFPVGSTQTLNELINSVRQIIENVEYRSIIEKHIDLDALRRLAIELIGILWDTTLDSDKKKLVNSLVRDIKDMLKLRSSAIQTEDVDIYSYCIDNKRVERFVEIVGALKVEETVFVEPIRGFRIEGRREPFRSASEVKNVSKQKTAFSEAYKKYSRPYDYLRELLSNTDLAEADLYKFFVKIHFRILNSDGAEVSGGERSEFRLLQEIADAQNFDILLVDEPESSFDNLFLNSDVNGILKSIAETMPVIVVTHNSTVGASVGADYLLHTKREIEDGKPVYRVFSGFPTDRMLKSPDGNVIDNHETLMNSLEAGSNAYERRRQGYEALKNQ